MERAAARRELSTDQAEAGGLLVSSRRRSRRCVVLSFDIFHRIGPTTTGFVFYRSFVQDNTGGSLKHLSRRRLGGWGVLKTTCQRT